MISYSSYLTKLGYSTKTCALNWTQCVLLLMNYTFHLNEQEFVIFIWGYIGGFESTCFNVHFQFVHKEHAMAMLVIWKNLKISQKRFYTWLRWKSWRIDKSKKPHRAVETDLNESVNKSWCTIIMWLRCHSSLRSTDRWKICCRQKRQIFVDRWGDCNIPHSQTWEKHVIFPMFFIIWGLVLLQWKTTNAAPGMPHDVPTKIYHVRTTSTTTSIPWCWPIGAQPTPQCTLANKYEWCWLHFTEPDPPLDLHIMAPLSL